MAQTKVLKKEELDRLVKFQEDERALIFDFGRLAYQIQALEEQKDKLLETKRQLEKASIDFGQELTKIYGEGTIDIKTGEITPVK